MQVLTAILPVLLMLMIGIICNKFQIIDQHGINSLKKIITNILLPFVLFNALSTATYNSTTTLILLVMTSHLLLSLAAGYLFRPLLNNEIKNHLPFMLAGFEGGMIGYPLYIALMGIDQLHNIATVDIANCIFSFTLYLALMTASEKGRVEPKTLLTSALSAPAFYGITLGVIFGITNITHLLIASPYGTLYNSLINMLASPVSALILLTVGYNLQFNRKVISAAAITTGIRLAVQSILLIGVWLILRQSISDHAMVIAILLYAFLPPYFVSAIFTGDEKKAAYASTTTSLYMAVSITAFTILAIYK